MITDLIIVLGVIICLVVLWISMEQLRQKVILRRMLRERGMTLDELETQNKNSGTLLLDYVYGRSIGLPAPTVWWTPHDSGQPYPCDVVIKTSKLIDAPKEMRDIAFLRQRFRKFPVLESNSL